MPAQEIIPSGIAKEAKQDVSNTKLQAIADELAGILQTKASLTGAPGGDFAGQDLLAELLDEAGDLGFNVSVRNHPKRDSNNALVLSDAPASILWYNGAVGPGPIINTTGYQSIVLTFGGSQGAYIYQTANDPEQFTTTLQNAAGWSTAGLTTPQTSGTAGAGTVFQFPVTGKYFRPYCVTAGTPAMMTIELRSAPATFIPQTQAVSITGNPAVVGNAAAAAAVTGNPVSVSGADAGGLTRRFLTDTNGAMVGGGPLPPGFQRAIYNAAFGPYTQALLSATAALSTFNPSVVGGLDQTNAVRSLQTDPLGRVVVRQAFSDLGDQSIPEQLYQINGALRAAVHLLAQIVAVCRGQTDPAPDDEPDSLIGQYMTASNRFNNLTN